MSTPTIKVSNLEVSTSRGGGNTCMHSNTQAKGGHGGECKHVET